MSTVTEQESAEVVRKNSVGMLFIGLGVGAVAAGITALLLAPKSGSETREMIKNRFSQMRDIVRPKAQEPTEPVE